MVCKKPKTTLFNPIDPQCPNCKMEGHDNLDIYVTLIVRQNIKSINNLPKEIKSEDSIAIWDSPNNSIICNNCGFTSKNHIDFEKK